MPSKPMAIAAPMGIHMVLSEMLDFRHICMQGNAISATIAGRAPRKKDWMMLSWQKLL